MKAKNSESDIQCTCTKIFISFIFMQQTDTQTDALLVPQMIHILPGYTKVP